MTLVPNVMEITGWFVAWPVGWNMAAGACGMGTMISGTSGVPEGRATVALLVRTPRTGNVTSILVCRLKRTVTTFVNRSDKRLVGCTNVLVKPPAIEFVNPRRFVNGNTALLVSGIKNIGTALV